MENKHNRRYSLLKVSVVVICFYLAMGILGLIIMAVTPGISSDAFKKFLDWKYLVNQVVGIIFTCYFYYFLINEYYRLLYERKKASAFIKPSLIAVGALVLYYAVYQLIFADQILKVTMNGRNQHLSVPMLIIGYGISSLFFMAISLLIAYLTNLQDDRKQKKVLEEQALQLEAEKSYANLNFLKAQINPHFLHNTLNFLYAKSLPYSDELAEGILTLSEIMRYALNQNTAVDSKVPLNDELEHLRNVIRINQLRYSNQLKINFKTEGDTSAVRVIPFVLITLVENAFKHGDLTHPDHPLTMKLQIDGQRLYFYCRNKKKTGLKELSTGIGLENIKKRLSLSYGENYSLNVKDETFFYTTELKIEKL